MEISFSTAKTLPETGVLALVVGRRGLGKWGKWLDKEMQGDLSRAIKSADFDGKQKAVLDIKVPAPTELDRILLVGIGAEAEIDEKAAETVGGVILGACQKTDKQVTVLTDLTGRRKYSEADCMARIALGAKLRSYRFDKYKTAKKDKQKLQHFTLATPQVAAARRAFAPLANLAEGIFLARDLVNEPANILTPQEFARRARLLSKHGVKVEVLSEARMKQLGMGSLLGVGQGSVEPSQLVIMQWQGAAKSRKPLAFIGKGVCFDTGGISLKPPLNMEDMRGDMGGAAAVTGLLYTLARRKARVNVVGVIGLVENMPSGEAQRPGDIVTSMSGQTIEVLNTDAEGRLVLADALWYTQKRFKPAFMIDLATLTGAILVALGKEYAGMFANDDKLSAKLTAAGLKENEKVWRMPLCPAFDKMIDSPNADVKNIGGRYAGSSTAAQFLQRFTNDLPWVHLDIAGTAMGSPKSPINHSWGSGFGVKLLNRFIRDNYERR